MRTTRTVVCKLDPTPEQASEIDATLVAFAAACDCAAGTARSIGSTNKVKVQHAAYREIRGRFRLSANLAIRAIARACAALKVPARMHSRFEPTSIDYDARIFAFQEWNWTFGLTLLSGRVKIATALGERQKSLLKGRKPTSAVLVKRRDGRYSLHVQLTGEAPDPIKTEGTLGVDLGRRRVAVDSDGTIHEAAEVNRVRKHYPKVRCSAQAKGTRGSKRFLKRLSGTEKRHQRSINHVIDAGVPAVLVDPRYTSKRCHICGELGHRDALLFSWTNHGDCDADINAALNIAVAGARVTAPELAGLQPQ